MWSNHRLLGACRALPETEYFAPRRCFFGSIHAALDHILIVDLLYLDRLRGTSTVPADCETLTTDLDDLTRRQSATDRGLLGYCEQQDAQSLTSTVRFTRADGHVCADMVASVLTHLFLHQVHHRGQVHDMLSQTDVAPPQLDEFFLDGDEPMRRDELRELGL